MASRRPSQPAWSPTPRQREVLAAYVEAGSIKQAAFALGVSIHTLKNHLGNMRDASGWPTERLIYEAAARGWIRERHGAFRGVAAGG